LGSEIATTQWSQVIAVRDGTDTEARRALENLCLTYWQPAYSFIRHLGVDLEEAKDLTQAYFTELLANGFLRDLDREKGRFRSFLFSSLRNFLSHQRDRSQALKRGGGTLILSLDIEDAERNHGPQAASQKTPEEIFEYRWAMTVVTRALDRLREDLASAGDERRFKQLRPYLTDFAPEAPYRDVAAALGMSEGAVKVAVHRFRKSFGRCLRAELTETVAAPADIEDELRHLLAVLRG
jgi:RNA polymerase sigma factor (sigma-70 family)